MEGDTIYLGWPRNGYPEFSHVCTSLLRFARNPIALSGDVQPNPGPPKMFIRPSSNDVDMPRAVIQPNDESLGGPNCTP